MLATNENSIKDLKGYNKTMYDTIKYNNPPPRRSL